MPPTSETLRGTRGLTHRLAMLSTIPRMYRCVADSTELPRLRESTSPGDPLAQSLAYFLTTEGDTKFTCPAKMSALSHMYLSSLLATCLSRRNLSVDSMISSTALALGRPNDPNAATLRHTSAVPDPGRRKLPVPQ